MLKLSPYTALMSLTCCLAIVNNDNHNKSDIREPLAMLKLDLAENVRKAFKSDEDMLTHWMNPNTWEMLFNLPHHARLLALTDVFTHFVKSNRFGKIEKQVESEATECKLPVLGQMSRMVLGNSWGTLTVPWFKLAGRDMIDALPEHKTLNKFVHSFMYEMDSVSSKQTLKDCGWELLDAQCVMEEEVKNDDGVRVDIKLNSCKKHFIDKLSGYNEDRTMLAINRKGNGNSLVQENTCVFVTHFTNDMVDVKRNYHIYEDDVTKWSKQNNTRLTFDEAKSLEEMTAMESGLTHFVFGGSMREYDVVRKTRPFQEVGHMLRNGTCATIIFVGASLGGRLAMMARIDYGQVVDKLYTDTCTAGVPCSVVSLAGGAPFFGDNVPTLQSEVRDSSCMDGRPADHLKDVLLFVEGDQVPVFPNPIYFGWDVWPLGKRPNWASQKGWKDALPEGIIKEFQHIKGTSLIEYRREIGIKTSDAGPKVETCVFTKVAPCNTSVWSYYNSPEFLEHNEKIRKPVKRTPDGMFYGCGTVMFQGLDELEHVDESWSTRWCGHVAGISPDYYDFVKDGKASSCDKEDFKYRTPLAPGSHLEKLWSAVKLPGALAKAALDISGDIRG